MSDHDDYIVVDKPSTYELDLFNDYLIARYVLHPKAKSNALENNLAILSLANDVEFSGDWNELK